jgi:hypothetical protein
MPIFLETGDHQLLLWTSVKLDTWRVLLVGAMATARANTGT